jgi:hypothetical protein
VVVMTMTKVTTVTVIEVMMMINVTQDLSGLMMMTVT